MVDESCVAGDSRTRSGYRLGRLLAPLFVSLFLVACAAEDYGRRADESAFPLIEQYHERTVGDRREWVEYPLESPPDEPVGVDAIAEDGGDDPPARELSLSEALKIAVDNNRDFTAQRESLYTQALSLVQAGWDFSPQLSASLGYMLRGGDLLTETEGLPEDPPRTHDFSANFGVSKRFMYGGALSLDLGTALARTESDLVIDRSQYNSNLNLTFSQPLLRGYGREVAGASLIQAERDMVYAIRDFVRFRESFTIDAAQQFYSLVQQKQSIANVQANLDGFVFARRQAEALFDVGRISELDVLRARRSELGSRNSLIEARQGYKLALDRFKVFLGLDPSEPLEVAPEAPEFTPVSYDVESAVQVALHNRLDLMNRREQLEDSERSVRVAKNALLPDLDVDLGYSVGAGPGRTFGNQGTNPDAYSAGVRLELPLNRVDERSAYRRAQISRDQARRSLEQFEDELKLAVVNSFRELERRVQSLEIQRQLIVDQQKNAKVAQLRFESGKVPNRDLVEAQQSLLEARNSLIQERVSYEIARLELLRALGILFIDEDGLWVE